MNLVKQKAQGDRGKDSPGSGITYARIQKHEPACHFEEIRAVLAEAKTQRVGLGFDDQRRTCLVRNRRRL